MSIHYAIMSNVELRRDYEHPAIGFGYDTLVRLVFSPVGGLDRMREQALAYFRVTPGERVLELGCGTGGMTARLHALGATVSAVDWSEPMLQRARGRASSVTFERCEITAYEPRALYDVVLFSFVLHELDASARASALAVASRALAADGRLAILDHGVPERGRVARALSAFVHAFEPASSRAWRGEQIDHDVRSAGFDPGEHHELASGLAVAMMARRPPLQAT